MTITHLLSKPVTLYTDTDGDGKACALLLAKWCDSNRIHIQREFPKCRTNVAAPTTPIVVMTDWVPNDLDQFLADNPDVQRCIVVDHHPWDDDTRTDPRIVKVHDTSMCAAQILYKQLGFKDRILQEFVDHIGYHDLFTAPNGVPLPEAHISLRAAVAKCNATVHYACSKKGTVDGFFASLHGGYFRTLGRYIQQVRDDDAFVARLMNSKYVKHSRQPLALRQRALLF